jgi:hypothetical protein
MQWLFSFVHPWPECLPAAYFLCLMLKVNCDTCCIKRLFNFVRIIKIKSRYAHPIYRCTCCRLPVGIRCALSPPIKGTAHYWLWTTSWLAVATTGLRLTDLPSSADTKITDSKWLFCVMGSCPWHSSVTVLLLIIHNRSFAVLKRFLYLTLTA